MIILVFICVITQNTFASCKVSKTPIFNFANDFALNDQFSFSSKGLAHENPKESFTVYGCSNEASQRKFIAIGWGAIFFGLNAKSKDVSYGERVDVQECSIKNNPFSPITSEQFEQDYRVRTQTINSCIKLKIKSQNDIPLVLSKNETACKFERINRFEAYMSGSYCFIQILPQAQYTIDVIQNPDCQQNLKQNIGVESARETSGMIAVSVVGNDTGKSEDNTMLGTKIIQLHFNPSSDLFDLTNNWLPRSPTYIADMPFPKVRMGKPRIQNTPDGSFIEMFYFADNRCPTTCKNKFCDSPCNFSVPLFGEITLYKIGKNKKKEYITSWYDGGVLPPQWMGYFAGDIKNFNNVYFAENEEYILEFVIRDPKIEYQSYTNSNKNLMPPVPGIIKWTSVGDLYKGVPDLVVIPSISDIGDSGDLTSDELSFDGPALHTRLRSEIDLISEILYWPPIYSRACQDGKCKRIGHDPILKSKIEFSTKIEGDDQEIVVFTRINQTTETKFSNLTKLEENQFPALECEYNNLRNLD